MKQEENIRLERFNQTFQSGLVDALRIALITLFIS